MQANETTKAKYGKLITDKSLELRIPVSEEAFSLFAKEFDKGIFADYPAITRDRHEAEDGRPTLPLHGALRYSFGDFGILTSGTNLADPIQTSCTGAADSLALAVFEGDQTRIDDSKKLLIQGLSKGVTDEAAAIRHVASLVRAYQQAAAEVSGGRTPT